MSRTGIGELASMQAHWHVATAGNSKNVMAECGNLDRESAWRRKADFVLGIVVGSEQQMKVVAV